MIKLLVFTAILVVTTAAGPLTGPQIIAKMDANRDHKTISYEGVMTIQVGDEIRVKNMKSRGISGKDGDKAIVEFTNPEDEGTKYLFMGGNLWIYFPDEDDVVKISGHMLKEGMMGSDVSYEDALESDKLANKYEIKISGEDTIQGQLCYVIDLNALVKNVPYYRRIMWVDKVTFTQWKEEMYAKSGKLLKVSSTIEVEKVGERYMASKVEIFNKLRRNSKTIFTMKKLELDVSVDNKEFSMRYLRR